MNHHYVYEVKVRYTEFVSFENGHCCMYMYQKDVLIRYRQTYVRDLSYHKWALFLLLHAFGN